MDSHIDFITLNDAFYDYIDKHRDDDVMRLRLKKHVDTDFPIDLAITQIEIRKRRIEQKLPTWAAAGRIVFPSLLSTEQCSSEITARYKAKLVRGKTLCDMTGGMGVDTFFMSHQVENALYIEQNELYCQLARHNFDILGANHIGVYHGNCCDYLNNSSVTFDTIYIDPARRGKSQERLYALSDCEPDVLLLLPVLLKRCKRLIIKMSPMVDVTRLREELSLRFQLYIVSVRNECKEMLAVIDTDGCHVNTNDEPIDINCVMCTSYDDYREVVFTSNSEMNVSARIACGVENYLYEPDVALLKAGVFKSLCERYGVMKLAINSHLYTSINFVSEFPGRSFQVVEVIPFTSSTCRQFASQYPSCNITTRNFPLSAIELRKRLKVRDGGDVYIMATCDACNNKLLIICNKINNE